MKEYRDKNGIGKELNRCPKCSCSLQHDVSEDNPDYTFGSVTYKTHCENKTCDWKIKEIYTFNRNEKYD